MAAFLFKQGIKGIPPEVAGSDPRTQVGVRRARDGYALQRYLSMSTLVCVMFGGYVRPSEALGLRFCGWAKPLCGMGSFYSLVLNPSEEGQPLQNWFLGLKLLGWVPKVIERFSAHERSFLRLLGSQN